MRYIFLVCCTTVLLACNSTSSSQSTAANRNTAMGSAKAHSVIPARSTRFSDPHYATSAKRALMMLSRYHYTDITTIEQFESRILQSLVRALDPSGSLLSPEQMAQLTTPTFSLQNLLSSGDIAVLDDAIDATTDILTRNLAQLSLQTSTINRPEPLTQAYYASLADAGFTQSEIDNAMIAHVQSLQERLTSLTTQQRYHLILSAFAGAVDPHTRYIPPINKPATPTDNPVTEKTKPTYGIGLDVVKQQTRVFVERADIQASATIAPGAEILAILNTSQPQLLWGLDAKAIEALLEGPPDSAVTLLVKQQDTLERITLQRAARADASNTPSTVMVSHEDNANSDVAVITIPSFYMGMTEHIERELRAIEQTGVNRLVIDLRNNGGGSLNEAATLTGLFIDSGPVFQMKDSAGRISVRQITRNDTVFSGDVFVLVNQGSAGSSEIFAAAIQDYQRGVVIGTATYGFGSIQQLQGLDRIYDNSDIDIGSLQYTVATFYRITGASTQSKGVTPDITLPVSEPWILREQDKPYALKWEQIGAANFQRNKGQTERVKWHIQTTSQTDNLSEDPLKAAIAIATAY